VTTPTPEDLEHYVMGEYDGDPQALEAALAEDESCGALLAEEARFELLLREAASAATFCPGCDDLVRSTRCDACGAAVKPGGYVVERVLVSNAHGRMYVARDADRKQVALKELAFVQSPTLAAIAAFEREAKFLRALEHPAIPRFVASFEEGTGVHVRYYLAQELVAGESLAARLEDHWFTEPEVIDVARQVLQVLVYLQSLSPMVIHRDIKPANLVTRADGSIAVVDFGAAHVQGTTAGSTSIGTFGYMPIEQLAGQVDATTDPYALGASLLHLLSRREPWRILQGVSLEGINVSPALRGFLGKLVAPEPHDRFPTAAAALEALERAVKGETMIDASISARAWVRPLLIAAASLVLVGSGLGGYMLLNGDSAEPTTPPGSAMGIVQVARPDALPSTICPTDDADCLFSAMSKFVDAMCACTNAACGDAINAQRKRWADDQLRRSAGADRHRDDERFTAREAEMWGRYSSCMAKVSLGAPTEDPPIPPGKPIDLSFKQAPLHDVIRSVGEQCNTNVVIPDWITGRVTVQLASIPCDQALEVLLESRGLWYRYAADGRMLRIGDRKQLDREREQARRRAMEGVVADVLPKGQPVDLDFKDVPLRELLQMLATSAGVNVVVPDEVTVRVTVRLKSAPWDRTLQTILEAHGLWYRYRANGKVVRVVDRAELDRDEAAARNRPNQ